MFQSISHQSDPTDIAQLPTLISISDASKLIGVAEQTARDWLWKNKFPVPTVKLNGKRMVPYSLLKTYLDGLVNAAVNGGAL